MIVLQRFVLKQELSQNINTLAFPPAGVTMQRLGDLLTKAVKKEYKGVGSGKKEKKTEEPE